MFAMILLFGLKPKYTSKLIEMPHCICKISRPFRRLGSSDQSPTFFVLTLTELPDFCCISQYVAMTLGYLLKLHTFVLHSLKEARLFKNEVAKTTLHQIFLAVQFEE